MGDDEQRSVWDDVAMRADRPLGDIETASARAMQRISIASDSAAHRLLDKAQRALDDGDLDRARRYVENAARLPFDDHEQVVPAAMSAHMELFSLITDAVEEAEEDDPRWLDAALDVLADADETGRHEIRDVLEAIEQDYVLGPAEAVRIRSAMAPIPARPPVRDRTFDGTELVDLVMSVLAACRSYRAALEARRH